MRKAKKNLKLTKPLRKVAAELRIKRIEVQNLRYAQECDRRLLREQSVKLGLLENEIWEAKRIAVRNSALFEIREPDPAYRLPGVPAEDGTRIDVTSDERSFSRSELAGIVADVPLHALLLNVEREAIEGAIHARVEFAELRAFKAACEKQEAVCIGPPGYHDEAMGCGLEDRGIRDRYEAMRHGWECAIDRVFSELPETFYLHPDPEAAGLRMRIAMLEGELSIVTTQRDGLLEFVKRVSEQTPEKPDYWSSCGQCQSNISDAEDAIASVKGGAA